ncbi:MAG: hypothetical protein L0207_00715 [Chlamydiae bacterium]|nr:hypothetical protein [Chlamydiota bacterium]
MKQKETLTNQEFQGLCKNSFELTYYAIRLARFNIRSGKEVSMEQILEEVIKHPDPSYLEELQKLETIEEMPEKYV